LDLHFKIRNLPSINVSARSIALLFSLSLAIECSSDIRSTVDDPDLELNAAAETGGPSPTIQLDSAATVTLTEGVGSAVIPLRVTRAAGESGTITLSARGATPAETQQFIFDFEQNLLEASETSTNLVVRLAIGPRPIQPHERTIFLTALSRLYLDNQTLQMIESCNLT